jgi:hypothetical protein
MNCPRCGLEIEEQHASFCPHCGERLDAFSTNLPAERATGATLPPPQRGLFPSQPIHEAPTRISAGSLPPGRRGWASDYGQPSGSPATPSTNADFYGPDGPAKQPPKTTARRPATLLPPAERRRTNGGRLILGILVLLIVFASGVGVGMLVAKPRSQPEPAASKTTAPTPTPQPSPTATPVEQIIFTDPLTGPTHPWFVDSTHCLFRDGSYHILADFICSAPIGIQSDVAISVQIKQITGTDRAYFGISLRYSGAGNFYDFLITSNSTWLFEKTARSTTSVIVPETASPALRPGLNKVNTLLVRVKGTHFDFFINGTRVGQANDSTFSSGLMGLIGANDTDVAFNNFQVATLT